MNKFKIGDIIIIEKPTSMFNGRIGKITNITKSFPQHGKIYFLFTITFYKQMFVVDFYFQNYRIIEEIFYDNELAKPSESELKKFKLFLEKVNAIEIAEKL